MGVPINTRPPSLPDDTAASSLRPPPDFHWRSSERLIVWCVTVLLGLIFSLAAMFEMNPDGISYLHLSDFVALGRWKDVIDGCWSPLYPVLLGVAGAIVKPSPYWEAPMVHAVNFLIYIAAFWSFRFFLSSVRRHQELAAARPGSSGNPIDFSGTAESISIHVLFLVVTLTWIGLAAVTPDLLVAAIVFAACGLAMRLRTRESRRDHIALGAIAGVGYLAKAVMFPLAFPLLLTAAWTPGRLRLSAVRFALSLAGFLVVSAPQIAAVSKIAGHLTYADTGGMAYAREVNGYSRYWTGEPEGSGTPVNPIRVLHKNPTVYEYAVEEPLSSYPLWDRPTVWMAGITPRFDLPAQFAVTSSILKFYLTLLASLIAIGAFLFLCRERTRLSADYVTPIASAIAAFGLYALVFAESRYLAAWAVVLLVAFAATLRFPAALRTAVSAAFVILALFQGTTAIGQVSESVERVIDFVPGDPAANQQSQVAARIRAMGIPQGARLASIGIGHDEYWARLARVQIAMEVSRPAHYWDAPDSVKRTVLESFRKAGASAVVTRHGPPEGPGEPWKTTGLGGYYVLSLAAVNSI
jgi:hypothetical protein